MKLCFTSLKSCMYCPSFVTNIFHPFIKVIFMKSKVHAEMRWKAKSTPALKPSFILLQAALWSTLDCHGRAFIFCCDPLVWGFFVLRTGQLGVAHHLSDVRAELSLNLYEVLCHFSHSCCKGYGLFLNWDSSYLHFTYSSLAKCFKAAVQCNSTEVALFMPVVD